MKHRIIVVLVSLVLLPVLGYGTLYFSPGWRFKRAYDALTVGMTEAQVVNVFRRPPDYECVYRETRVLYYSRGTFFDNHPTDIPASVVDKAQLPNIYGAAQIAIGRDGTVSAFTWNGEELVVRTMRGNYGGSNLSRLDDTFFD